MYHSQYNLSRFLYIFLFFIPFLAACQDEKSKKDLPVDPIDKSNNSETKYYQWDMPRVVHHRNGESMPYKVVSVRLDANANTLDEAATPSTLDKKNIPVILFLHGAGQRGNDNESQISGAFPELIKTITSIFKEEFDILAPQCPTLNKWVEKEWSAPSHKMDDSIAWTLELAKAALEQYLDYSPHVDKKRIYLVGLSMGGYGVWELLQRYPNYFAGAIPICGGGDPAYAKNIATTPVWAVHGAKDKVVLPSRSQEMVDAVLKAGGKCQFTLLEDKAHDSWTYTFKNKDIIKWLWSQRLK